MKFTVLMALALVACARPIPDRATAQKGRYYREAVDFRGERCLSELPLTVAFDGIEPSEFYPADLPWSRALGYPVTMAAVGGEAPDLIVRLDVRPKDHPNWLASVHSECDGGRLRQVMSLYVAGDGVETFYVVLHEVGHALGIGHSPAEWSIMYPSVHGLMLDEERVQWVRPDDVAALRRIWHRR